MVSNQAPFSLFDRRPQRTLLEYSAKHGIYTSCYSTQAPGTAGGLVLLFKTVCIHRPYSDSLSASLVQSEAGIRSQQQKPFEFFPLRIRHLMRHPPEALIHLLFTAGYTSQAFSVGRMS